MTGVLQPLLAALFVALCTLPVLLWAWRRQPFARYGTLACLAIGYVLVLVQGLPAADKVSDDRLWYLRIQVQLARYFESLPPHELPVEFAASLVDKLTHARQAIWSHAPVYPKLNLSQLTLGALALVVTGGWSMAPCVMWTAFVAFGLGYLLEAGLPFVPGWRRWVFVGLVIATPAGAWFRSINTKEPILVAATGIWGATVIRIATEGPRPRYVILLLAMLALMFLFRPPYVLVLLFFLVLGVLFTNTHKLTTWLIAGGLGMGMLTLACFPQLIRSSRTQHVVGFLNPKQLASYYTEDLIETRAEYGSGKKGAGGNVMKDVLKKGPAGLIYTPVFLVYYVFGPFPWQTGSMLMNVAKVQALLYWFITLLLVWNLVHWRRLGPAHRLMFWVTGGVLVVMAIVESNLGTGMRHRTVWEPLLFFVACAVPLPPRRVLRRIVSLRSPARSARAA